MTDLKQVLAAIPALFPAATIKSPASPYTGSNKHISGARVLSVSTDTCDPFELLTANPREPSRFKWGGTSWGDFKIKYGRYDSTAKPESYRDLEPLMDLNTYYPSMADHMRNLTAESYAFDHVKDNTYNELLAANIAAFHRGDAYMYRRKNKFAQLMCNSWWFAEAYCEQMFARRFNLKWCPARGLQEYGIRVVPICDPKFDNTQPVVAPEPKHPDPDEYNITVFMGFSVGAEPEGFVRGSNTAYPGDCWSFAPSFSFIMGWTLDALLTHMPLVPNMAIGWSRFRPNTGRGCCAGDLLPADLLYTYVDAVRGEDTYEEYVDYAPTHALPWPNNQCVLPHGFDNSSGLGALRAGWSNERTHTETGDDGIKVSDHLDAWLTLWSNYKRRIAKATKKYIPVDAGTTSTCGKLRQKRLGNKKFKYKVR